MKPTFSSLSFSFSLPFSHFNMINKKRTSLVYVKMAPAPSKYGKVLLKIYTDGYIYFPFVTSNSKLQLFFMV
jgi:hypothetical protein